MTTNPAGPRLPAPTARHRDAPSIEIGHRDLGSGAVHRLSAAPGDRAVLPLPVSRALPALSTGSIAQTWVSTTFITSAPSPVVMTPPATAAATAAIVAAIRAGTAVGGRSRCTGGRLRRDDAAILQGTCHSRPGQRLDFAVEQDLGGARGVATAARWLAGGVAGLALHEVALRGPLHLILHARFRLGWVPLLR